MGSEKEYDIFYKAFDIDDPAERRLFIRGSCKGDEELFKRVLLLFPDDDLVDDDSYGDYIIEKPIGKGGMGVVFRAYNSKIQTIKGKPEPVALKTITTENLTDPKKKNRFLEEIRTLSKLNHRNIAGIIDVGRSKHRKPYFVMEYVQGTPITEYCDAHHLSIEERIELFQVLLRAIEYTHVNGFIHCDIKPENILVSEDGKLKIIDFGVAIKYGSYVYKEEPVNYESYAFTPNFSSPEQIRGGKELSVRSDIYSLGVVLFKLITSNLPRNFYDQKSYKELLQAVEEQEPISIRRAYSEIESDARRERVAEYRNKENETELWNKLTSRLNEIVQKAIASKPENRYSSVTEFDQALDEYINDNTAYSKLRDSLSVASGVTRRTVNRAPYYFIFAFAAILIGLIVVSYQSKTVRTVPYYANNKFFVEPNSLNLGNTNSFALDTSSNLIRKRLKANLDKSLRLIEENDYIAPSIKYNAWSIANYVAALQISGIKLDSSRIDKAFNEMATENGCWKEEQFSCKMIISGWVMLAKAELKKPILTNQLDFVLNNQSPDGWFPAYPSDGSKQNAATFPTAFILLGLVTQYNSGQLTGENRERARVAITKAAEWLMSTERASGANGIWSDCPNVDREVYMSTPGLDGAVIVSLHAVNESSIEVEGLTSRLQEIDSRWLRELWETRNFQIGHHDNGRCVTTMEGGGVMDRSMRFTIPWMIAATTYSFRNGTPWEKAIAQRWIATIPFSEEYPKFPSGMAEYLIAIHVLRDNWGIENELD